MEAVSSQNSEIVASDAYVNPVFDHYFADPFVFWFEGTYYAVGTGGPARATNDSVFQILTSKNLINWSPSGFAMKMLSGLYESSYWAPEVSVVNGKFYLYYSVGEGDRNHQIRVASSSSPIGPYIDLGQLTADDICFSIDPHVYRHSDGKYYLYYATDFLDGARPGTALVVDRLLEPNRLEGNPQVVARATSDWQRYECDRQMYGSRYDWHTLEGPAAVQYDGRIYVFYSGGNWQNGKYGVDYVVADHPLGPFENTTKEHPRVLRTLPGKVIGPGHNSVILGPDRETHIAVYHGWNPAGTERLMRIDPIVWTSAGPVIDGPSTSVKMLPQ